MCVFVKKYKPNFTFRRYSKHCIVFQLANKVTKLSTMIISEVSIWCRLLDASGGAWQCHFDNIP